MDATAIKWISTVHLAVGITFIVLGAILSTGRVPMNTWFGVRLPVSYKSIFHWNEMNRFGGHRLRNAGRLLALIDLGVIFAMNQGIAIPPTALYGFLMSLPVILIGVAMYRIWKHGKEIEKVPV